MRITLYRGRIRRGTLRILKRTAGIALCGLILLASGCGLPDTGAGTATRVLQSVDIALDPSGEIRTVSGNAVYLNQDSGASRSDTQQFDAAKVVDDLPVRLTTRYRTVERTGSALSDLTGFTGRIEIEITIENLLLASEQLTYDVAGESRTSPALVSTPLSIAASATLPGVSPSSVIFDVDAPQRTNGVVNAVRGGSTVQWATMLAPPRSEATTTLTLVADVTDFTVPTFDIAVQAGLHTDLSFAGVTATAFAHPTEELDAQQQAIDLITEVNEVLTRAGATITEIRKNLTQTSDTLGVRASRKLATSSSQLTSMMRSLGSQITSLGHNLEGSVTGASSAMESELAQIVSSINAMLGATNGTPPELIDGAGCAATMSTEGTEKDTTVYSIFLRLSALLNGYADAAEGCRDEILVTIETLIGPKDPDPASCNALPKVSATCALFQNTESVLASLDELLLTGQAIAAGVDTNTIEAGLDAHDALTLTLTEIDTEIATLHTQSDDTSTWESLLTTIEDAQDSTSVLAQLRTTLVKIRSALAPGGQGYVQQEAVAEMLCELVTNGGASDVDGVEEIRAQLVDARCDGTPHHAGDIPATGTSTSRLKDQAVALEAAIDELDTGSPAATIHALAQNLKALHDSVDSALAAAKNGSSEFQLTAKDLDQLLAQAVDQSTTVRNRLEAALTEQGILGGEIDNAFAQAKAQSAGAISTELEAQIAALNAERIEATGTLSTSYQLLIDGLRASAEASLSDGKGLVKTQKGKLGSTHRRATQALDAQTTRALRSIEQSTGSATRDV